MELNYKQLFSKSNAKWWIASGIFLFAIMFTGEARLIDRYQQRKEISRLKEEINKYNEIFEKDKASLERLKNDPEAIVEVARERYYMKTADEDIFILEEKKNDED